MNKLFSTIFSIASIAAIATILVSCDGPATTGTDLPPVEDTLAWADTLRMPCAESHIAYLSAYPTPDQLVAEGDDDEASAWLWMHEQYPEARYLYLGDIHSEADLDSLHVLFWLRDVESDSIQDVLTFSPEAMAAAPFIAEWYRRGGNVILWSHAVLYIEELGRLPKGTYTAPDHDFGCGYGHGHLDEGHWMLSVQLFPGGKFKKDHSTHPLFRDLPIFDNNDLRGVMMKGPGWTEDHNCLFFNYPEEITGRSREQEICYTLLTDYFGIYPLGVWDSQIWWVSQLNVYELGKGQTDYEGRALCIGNGGCEFSMKSYRQTGVTEKGEPVFETTDDRSACPTNNIYQANVLQMAKNAIEYMRL